MTACVVDHEERRQMSLLFCYACDEPLQSVAEANEIRWRLGKHTFFGSDRVLHSDYRVCSVCKGSGMVSEGKETEE